MNQTKIQASSDPGPDPPKFKSSLFPILYKPGN